MSTNMLYRLSGGALLVGGTVMAIGLVGALFVIGSSPPDNASAANASLPFALAFLVIVCGLVLIAAGMPGMYLQQARRVGVAGLIGFVLTVFGVLLDLGLALFATIVVPWIAVAAPKLQYAGPVPLFILLYGAFLLLGIGSLVLGLAMAQADFRPRGVTVLLIISGLANLVAIPAWPISLFGFIGQALFAGGLAWVGYALVSQRVEEAMVPRSIANEARS
ncbi:MAG: hypothetical protein NVS4B11_00660 [Ktedonobacteraceae bacterium]